MMPNGVELPIAFASHSNQEIDSCLIFWGGGGGGNKFRSYLYGRLFMLMTDNKTLQCILGPLGSNISTEVG